MRRIYITGTDTGVGKTRVTAAVAKAVCLSGEQPTIVKLVQTGLPAGVPGDAHEAGALAGCEARELHRFEKPADPWTAAQAAGANALRAEDIARELRPLPGSLVAEGSGGAAVPLNAHETISDVAARCALKTILVVGLRLGCINHALLSLEYLRRRGITVLGAILCEMQRGNDTSYHQDVRNALRKHCSILDVMFFDNDAAACVDAAARRLEQAPQALKEEYLP